MLTAEERTDLVALLKECGNTQAALVADRLEVQLEPTDELVAEAYAALELERDILLAKKATLERVRDQVIEGAAIQSAVTQMVEDEAAVIIDDAQGVEVPDVTTTSGALDDSLAIPPSAFPDPPSSN